MSIRLSVTDPALAALPEVQAWLRECERTIERAMAAPKCGKTTRDAYYTCPLPEGHDGPCLCGVAP